MILFNKQQYILFSHHHSRAINDFLSSSDSDYEDENGFHSRISSHSAILRNSMMKESQPHQDKDEKKQLEVDHSTLKELLGF